MSETDKSFLIEGLPAEDPKNGSHLRKHVEELQRTLDPEKRARFRRSVGDLLFSLQQTKTPASEEAIDSVYRITRDS